MAKKVESSGLRPPDSDEIVDVAADDPREKWACTPVPLDPNKFNKFAIIPHGCKVEHIQKGMQEFLDFLGFINVQLNGKGILRFEAMLMTANFSSMVGEFMGSAIPKYCPTLVKNTFHNGHPDLVPINAYAGNAILHGEHGIEIKGSRYEKGWQGHNAEDCWLMVFVFDGNRQKDAAEGLPPRKFRFKAVYLGQLTKADWKFSGRSAESRRTITAAVLPSGFDKMKANWIYYDDAVPADQDIFEILGGQ